MKDNLLAVKYEYIWIENTLLRIRMVFQII